MRVYACLRMYIVMVGVSQSFEGRTSFRSMSMSDMTGEEEQRRVLDQQPIGPTQWLR